MTGGLMQLVAYGAQDIYLTGNPMITYFKVVYRRHTNFAMECIEQTFNGTIGFGNKVTALISRNGDLISGLTLEAVLPTVSITASDSGRWTNDVGHHLIEECIVEIGGQQIDKHYSDWLEIWAQLTVPAAQKQGYREMIGQDPRLVATGLCSGLQATVTDGGGGTANLNAGARTNSDGNRTLYIPLQFWFCRNVGLALPLIALQYHEVKVSVKFQTFTNLVERATTSDILTADTTLDATLWADYIYLDTDERRRFAQVSHEYLIEQLQYQSKSSSSTDATVELTFNHPVKELIWVIREDGFTENEQLRQWSNYTEVAAGRVTISDDWHTRPFAAAGTFTAVNPTESAKLKLNGHDRFATRNGDYFNLEQTCNHHTCVPDSPGINVYSFALKPEEHQPSGTCNFSRIDNAQLVITRRTATAATVKVFAVNYNVLRIMSGMGGLAYSN